jgi:hypothetical protein
MSNRDPEDYMDPSDPRTMDLGHSVLAQFYGLHGSAESVKAGILYEHPDGKGGRCWGGVSFKGVNPADPRGWDVQSLDPLTISPSVLCLSCQHHGFIREGKWVPA